MELGQITPAQAADVFDGLRYRWRGDATELETIRALGQLYLGQGRYREALEALRSAGKRLPDLPEALQLQADLAAAFRALFLDGLADGLEPIQALALFCDFKELAPHRRRRRSDGAQDGPPPGRRGPAAPGRGAPEVPGREPPRRRAQAPRSPRTWR